MPIYKNGDAAPFDLVVARQGPKILPVKFQGPPLSLAQVAYFFGYIEYLDIFKVKRTSRFRMIITPSGGWEPDGPPAWNDWD